MRITAKILSIPPYVSTSWSQVHSLYMQDKNLIIRLADGALISIPNLPPADIEAIFTAHSAFIDNFLSNHELTQENPPVHFLRNTSNSHLTSLPSEFMNEGMGAMHLNLENMETFRSSLLHNLAQAHMPNLPVEILNKIAAITKIIAPGEIQNMPKPEPHCNCPHCQIARAIHNDSENATQEASHSPIENKKDGDEPVTEQDLAFQQWGISQIGDRLYCVANKLDPQEKYRVYLGEPVGCTCGVAGCEHILAVLKS